MTDKSEFQKALEQYNEVTENFENLVFKIFDELKKAGVFVSWYFWNTPYETPHPVVAYSFFERMHVNADNIILVYSDKYDGYYMFTIPFEAFEDTQAYVEKQKQEIKEQEEKNKLEYEQKQAQKEELKKSSEYQTYLKLKELYG